MWALFTQHPLTSLNVLAIVSLASYKMSTVGMEAQACVHNCFFFLPGTLLSTEISVKGLWSSQMEPARTTKSLEKFSSTLPCH